jgi:hypothetical protein
MQMSESFKNRYSLPDIAVVELEGVVFHVRLPTTAHRQFERATADVFTEPLENVGSFRRKANLNMEQMFGPLHKAFIRTCVVKVEGLDDYDPETFVDKYPWAAEELYDQALALASRAEEEAAEQVGKSPASLPGLTSGGEKKSSMPASLSEVG